MKKMLSVVLLLASSITALAGQIENPGINGQIENPGFVQILVNFVSALF